MKVYKPVKSRADLLTARERHVRRCECGAWAWDQRPCLPCSLLGRDA